MADGIGDNYVKSRPSIITHPLRLKWEHSTRYDSDSYITFVDSGADDPFTLQGQPGVDLYRSFSMYDPYGNPSFKSETSPGPNHKYRQYYLSYFNDLNLYILGKEKDKAILGLGDTSCYMDPTSSYCVAITGPTTIQREFDSKGNVKYVNDHGVVTDFTFHYGAASGSTQNNGALYKINDTDLTQLSREK